MAAGSTAPGEGTGMYAIRVDTHGQLLRVELSGRVRSSEALRAISQSAVLAEASGLRAILCDITKIERGPGSLLLIATALNASHRPGMRIALLVTSAQRRMATRLVRFSGLRREMAVFEDAGGAHAWLVETAGIPPARSLRAEAERLLGRPLVVEPARGAHSHESAPPAA